MKPGKPIAALLAAILIFATNAEASCPSIYQVSCCGNSWYEFDVDTTCVSTSGVSSTTLSACSSNPAYKYNPGVGNSATWSFVIPADGTPINGGSTYYRMAHWSVSVYVDFNSPTHSNWDNLSGTLQVYHNGSYTNYTIFNFNGAVSLSQSCTRKDVSFSAVNGDTIIVYITGGGDSSATVKATYPTVFNTI